MLHVVAHPLLDLAAFVSTFSRPLGEVAIPPGWGELMQPDAVAPLTSSDSIRETVRALLRHGGFRPTGRSKPASEYLIKAAREGMWKPINAAVDACNIVSLHSGLPISVIDLDKAKPPFIVMTAAPGDSYVFNASGQAMDLAGLLCLHDAAGPCANAVKDSQRTKTGPETTRTLSVIWGSSALPGRTGQTETWYQSLVEESGAATERIIPVKINGPIIFI